MSEYIVRMPSDMPYEIKAELNAWYINSEPIVRCRDCKHSDTLESAPSVVVRCCYKNRDKLGVPRVVGDDGFCAWGERRER